MKIKYKMPIYSERSGVHTEDLKDFLSEKLNRTCSNGELETTQEIVENIVDFQVKLVQELYRYKVLSTESIGRLITNNYDGLEIVEIIDK